MRLQGIFVNEQLRNYYRCSSPLRSRGLPAMRLMGAFLTSWKKNWECKTHATENSKSLLVFLDAWSWEARAWERVLWKCPKTYLAYFFQSTQFLSVRHEAANFRLLERVGEQKIELKYRPFQVHNVPVPLGPRARELQEAEFTCAHDHVRYKWIF